LLWCGRGNGDVRAPIAFVLGPLALMLGFAFADSAWWGAFDGMALVLVVATTAATTGRWRLGWSARVALVFAPGVWLVLADVASGERASRAEAVLEAGVVRDVAHRLANRPESDKAVIFAPPAVRAGLW